MGTIFRAWFFTILLSGLSCIDAYAQLADVMLCADESCSNTISEGEARLAYRPKDDKFLHLKRGDVVLVKSKNAGKKSHLWGGEVMGKEEFGFFPSSFIKEVMVFVKNPTVGVSVKDFLEKRKSPAVEDAYSQMVTGNQKITIEKKPKKDNAEQSSNNKQGKEKVTDTQQTDSARAQQPSEDDIKIQDPPKEGSDESAKNEDPKQDKTAASSAGIPQDENNSKMDRENNFQLESDKQAQPENLSEQIPVSDSDEKNGKIPQDSISDTESEQTEKEEESKQSEHGTSDALEQNTSSDDAIQDLGIEIENDRNDADSKTTGSDQKVDPDSGELGEVPLSNVDKSNNDQKDEAKMKPNIPPDIAALLGDSANIEGESQSDKLQLEEINSKGASSFEKVEDFKTGSNEYDSLNMEKEEGNENNDSTINTAENDTSSKDGLPREAEDANSSESNDQDKGDVQILENAADESLLNDKDSDPDSHQNIDETKEGDLEQQSEENKEVNEENHDLKKENIHDTSNDDTANPKNDSEDDEKSNEVLVDPALSDAQNEHVDQNTESASAEQINIDKIVLNTEKIESKENQISEVSAETEDLKTKQISNMENESPNEDNVKGNVGENDSVDKIGNRNEDIHANEGTVAESKHLPEQNEDDILRKDEKESTEKDMALTNSGNIVDTKTTVEQQTKEDISDFVDDEKLIVSEENKIVEDEYTAEKEPNQDAESDVEREKKLSEDDDSQKQDEPVEKSNVKAQSREEKGSDEAQDEKLAQFDDSQENKQRNDENNQPNEDQGIDGAEDKKLAKVDESQSEDKDEDHQVTEMGQPKEKNESDEDKKLDQLDQSQTDDKHVGHEGNVKEQSEQEAESEREDGSLGQIDESLEQNKNAKDPRQEYGNDEEHKLAKMDESQKDNQMHNEASDKEQTNEETQRESVEDKKLDQVNDSQNEDKTEDDKHSAKGQSKEEEGNNEVKDKKLVQIDESQKNNNQVDDEVITKEQTVKIKAEDIGVKNESNMEKMTEDNTSDDTSQKTSIEREDKDEESTNDATRQPTQEPAQNSSSDETKKEMAGEKSEKAIDDIIENEKSRVGGCIEHERIGMTNYCDDVLLKWFFIIPSAQLPNSPSLIFVDSAKPVHVDGEDYVVQFNEPLTNECFTYLAHHPTLKWFLPKSYFITPVQKPVTLTTEHDAFESTRFLTNVESSSTPKMKQCTYYNRHPLLRWFLPPSSLVSSIPPRLKYNTFEKDNTILSAQVGDNRQFTDLFADPLLKWFLCTSVVKHQVQPPSLSDIRAKTGFTDLSLDPLLKWFIPKYFKPSLITPIQAGVEIDSSDESFSEDAEALFEHNNLVALHGSDISATIEAHPSKIENILQYTDLKVEPLLKWFLSKSLSCRSSSAIQGSEKSNLNPNLYSKDAETVDKNGRLIVLTQNGDCLNVKDDPLTQKTFPVLNSIFKSKAELDGNDKNQYYDMKLDPLLKYFIPNTDSLSKLKVGKINVKELADNLLSRESRKRTELNDHPLLKWFFMKKSRVSAAKVPDDDFIKQIDGSDRNQFYDMKLDPLLKHFFPNIDSLCKFEIEKINVKELADDLLGMDGSKRTELSKHPLLKWFFMKKSLVSAAKESDDEFVEQMKDGSSSLTTDSLLKWFVVIAAKCNENSKIEIELPTPSSLNGDSHSSNLLHHPLLKWILIRSAQCKLKTEEENDENDPTLSESDYEEAYEVDVESLDEDIEDNEEEKNQCYYEDHPVLKYFKPDEQKCFPDEEPESEIDDTEETEVGGVVSVVDPRKMVWMSLRNMINSYRELYDDVSGSRVVVTEIIQDLKILRKSKPEIIEGLNDRGRKLKNEVIDIENKLLNGIEILSNRFYAIDVSKSDVSEIEQQLIPQYDKTLNDISAYWKTLKEGMNALHNEVFVETYGKKENNEISPNENQVKVAEDEIKKLQEQLVHLGKKLETKDIESSNVVQKMMEDAEKFKSRISDLEKEIESKKAEEVKRDISSEEREKKIEERLHQLQTELQKSQNDERIQLAHEDTMALKNRLQEMESSIKMTVEADKPYLERISLLEEELASRKKQESNRVQQEKQEAVRLQMKLLAMERQLRKNKDRGDNQLLNEAKELREKIKDIEQNLIKKSEDDEKDMAVEKENLKLQNRIDVLEEELQKQLQEQKLKDNTLETKELKAKIFAMEERLKKQEEAKNLSNSVNANTTAKVINSTEAASEKHLSKEEVLSLLNKFFFQSNDDEKNGVTPIMQLKNQSHTGKFDEQAEYDFKCNIEPEKRKACGSAHFSKEFCSALRCCWDEKEDSGAPPCYFSSLQMANTDHSLQQIVEKENEEQGAESYETLHEGKLVDWDEALDSKPDVKKTQDWDEALGQTDGEDDDFNLNEFAKTANSEHQQSDDEKADTVSDKEVKEGDQESVAQGQDDKKEKPTLPPDQVDQIQPPKELTDDNKTNLKQEEKSVVSDENRYQDIQVKVNTVESGKGTPELDESTSQESVVANNENTTGDKKYFEEDADGHEAIKDPDTNALKEEPESDKQALSERVEDDKVAAEEEDPHIYSVTLRVLFIIYSLPFDVIYIFEPFFSLWLSLLPEEYQNGVHGVSWSIILGTFFIGFLLIWLMVCRSRASSRKIREREAVQTIEELRNQIDMISSNKLEKENELQKKEIELDRQAEESAKVTREKTEALGEKNHLEHLLREYKTQHEAMQSELKNLNVAIQEKDRTVHEVLSNSQQIEKSLGAQQEAIAQYEVSIAQLQNRIREDDLEKKKMDESISKFQEKIKTLEKTKGETKKEGKSLKEQVTKLNEKITEQEKLINSTRKDMEQKNQEIDILKDCILQFKGAQDYLTEEGEDPENEGVIEKQKEKMKSLIDVSHIKSVLQQTKAEMLQVTYKLEAEQKSKIEVEARISELEATIKGDQAVKNNLEREKQTLESRLTVMQDFYAKREVEIQSKLGLEQSKRESDASLLEERQQQHVEVLQQLEAYKKMGEEAKKQYEDAERQHKQEIMGFEKKSHDSWLANRDAERKLDEANKHISQLQLEITDLQRCLRDIERDPIIRPRPERHGPPGAPPPFGPPRRPPGVPASPLHFRKGPPSDIDRRSPPPLSRRPHSPGNNSISEETPKGRPPSRPDRPPSAHSLPPMDRRPPSGPPPPMGQPYPGPPPPSRGRGFAPYRGMPPQRPPPSRDFPPHSRPPPGPRMGGPMTSSPYMDHPPMEPNATGPHSQSFTQASLHAPPPQMTGDSLHNAGFNPSPVPVGANNPPPMGNTRGPGAENPFRRAH